jgi:hypothetical protein
MAQGEVSKIINWPDLGPYEPAGEKAMKGKESAGPKHTEQIGIGPDSVDPQVTPSDKPGNS